MTRVRRGVLIVNPTAYSVTKERRRAVAERLAERMALEEVETKGRGHASEVAAAAADSDADIVVVLGGDGTINEAVNGMAGTRVPLGIAPGGGANVLARALGFPSDVLEGTGVLLDRLDGPPRRIPLGRVEGRYFVANCGMGFDAAIVRRVEERRTVRGRVGEWHFVRAGIREFFLSYDRRVPHLRVTGADPPRVHDGLFLAIAQNLDPYTYLGKRAMRLCADADIDGGLDLFALDTLRTGVALRRVVSSFRSAQHAGRPHVTSLVDQRELRIESDLPMGVQMDGEFLGERESIVVEAVPDALSVIA